MRTPLPRTAKVVAGVALAVAIALACFPSAWRPSAPILQSRLLFVPTEAQEPGSGGSSDPTVATPSQRYVVERSAGGGNYVARVGKDGIRRLPRDWGDGASISLVDVRGPHGTRTYMHVAIYGRWFFDYGRMLTSALYEMTGEEATKIADEADVGFLQDQDGMPMPGAYVARNGDLYLLAPDREVEVVRDGRVVARGQAPGSAPDGNAVRYLLMESRKGAAVMSVLKPRTGGMPRKPTLEDVERQYVVMVAG
jgi:hypothetical protein